METGAPLEFDAVPVATPPGGPLAVELVPAPDPWEVARKLAHLPDLLFLDSAEKHEERGRYSYVTALAARTFRDFDTPTPSPGVRQGLELFRQAASAFQSVPDLPPFQGGFAGYFGYEWGRHFERLPVPRADEFNAPTLHLGLYEWVVSFDHEQRRAWIVASGNPTNPREVQQRAEFDLAYVRDLLVGPVLPPQPPERDDEYDVPNHALVPQYSLLNFPNVTSNFSREGYEAAVRRVVEYIHAGDCFQVNLSQRLIAPLREHPLELYGAFRALNPPPFVASFDLGEFCIPRSSPERSLRAYRVG